MTIFSSLQWPTTPQRLTHWEFFVELARGRLELQGVLLGSFLCCPVWFDSGGMQHLHLKPRNPAVF